MGDMSSTRRLSQIASAASAAYNFKSKVAAFLSIVVLWHSFSSLGDALGTDWGLAGLTRESLGTDWGIWGLTGD